MIGQGGFYREVKCEEGFFIPFRISETTQRYMKDESYILRLKGYRNVSSAYIHKKGVRDYFLSKYEGKCAECGSDVDLQLHHITSVSRFAQDKLDYRLLNQEDNITVLCKKCHSHKER